MYQIKIPKNLKLEWNDSFLKIEGPYGILLKRKDNIFLKRNLDFLNIFFMNVNSRESFFLLRLRNLLHGASKGFSCKLRLNGVGFKVFFDSFNKKILRFKIGFSHEVFYTIPNDVSITISKNKNTLLRIKGKEISRVKQVAAEIRKLRIPDSYKGKGIQYSNEVIVLKKGKKEGK